MGFFIGPMRQHGLPERNVMSQTIQIPVDDVIVGNRHRQEMGDIARLANSIADLGLLQPIGVDSRNHLAACRIIST